MHERLQWTHRPITVSRLLFFDIETTGLRPDRGGQSVEMAVVDRNGERFSWHQHEATPHDGALKQALIGLLPELCAGVVVGHNVQFDFGFIAYEAERYGLEGPELSYIDTLGLARRLLAGMSDYRLSTLLRSLDLTVAGDLHTAVADARATQALFWRLVEEGGYKSLADAGLKRLGWSTY